MDIMLDLETLGTKPGCVVLSIGAVAFDPFVLVRKEPTQTAPMETFYANIDLWSSLLLGLKIEDATLEWWRVQSDEAKSAYGDGVWDKLGSVVSRFNQWANKLPGKTGDSKIWAKSPDFDCAIWEHCAALVKDRVPWTFRDKADVRTLTSIPDRLGLTKPSAFIGTRHNAVDDALSQVTAVQEAIRNLVNGTP